MYKRILKVMVLAFLCTIIIPNAQAKIAIDENNIMNNRTENGWITEGGKTYYYENGKMVHGFKEINGKTYFFGITKGALLTGWQELPEGRFYLYEDGSIKQIGRAHV